MTARVDAAAGVVVDGDEAWPLLLDCRTGGAVVGRPGREIVVSPLRWRHKQHLARWAHLGPAFVAGQRAALAVEPGTVLDPAERAVVEAVAEFLDGADALPCEPCLLAVVTAEACRATGLPPAAFDDRDATEVELIWRTAPTGPAHPPGPDGRGAAPPAPDPWADATSIVFTAPPGRSTTPEPPGPPEPEARDADGGGPGAATPGPAVPPASARRREAPRYRVAPVPAPRPAVDRAIAPAGAALVTAPDLPVAAPGSPVAPAPASDRPGAAPALLASSPPSVPSRSPAGAAVDTSPTSRPETPWPVVRPGPAAPPAAVPAGSAAVRRPHAPAHGPVPGTEADPAWPDAVTHQGDLDIDHLVASVTERLAEQLSRAAADLGVEI